MTSKPIAVGVDGRSSTQALRWAVEYAVARNASVEVVHALPAPPRDGSDGDDELRRKRGEALVVETAALARGLGTANVEVSVLDQAVAAALVAASGRARLVVIGRRRTTGPLGRRSDSISRHLSRHAACPVVVVPNTDRNARTTRIVLLLNGGQADRAVLAFAFEEASTTGAEIEAFRALPEPGAGSDSSALLRQQSSDQLMAEELARYQAKNPNFKLVHESTLRSANRSLRDAAKDADLIVLPARTPNDEMLATVEAELVALQHAPCPVVYAR